MIVWAQRPEMAGDGNAQAQLNRAALLEHFAGDATLLCDIANTFLAHSPQLVSEIRRAVTDHDARRIRHAAHSLKGSVANFGAQEAVDTAFRLERMGAESQLDGADQVCTDLEDLMRRLEAELGQIVGRG